jgi:SAM-dependent methyltransferase
MNMESRFDRPPVHEAFNGAVHAVYRKWAALLPQRSELMVAFHASLGRLPDDATVIDIGMGSGGLAREILSTHPEIGRYIGLEPACDMVAAIPADLRLDHRLLVIEQGFDDWEGDTSVADAVVMRYVIHDFPDQLQTWYEKITRLLKPGGRFVDLDVTFAEDPKRTWPNRHNDIRLVRSVVCDNAAEEEAKERLIHHLCDEVAGYRPLAEHLEIIRSVGLHPKVLGRANNNYLLFAEKPPGR